jgi:predicted ribosome quality control (RQC) complex YloA/Tae2 family protein
MQTGQLILAYQHAIEPASDRLDIPELFMTIPLDPLRSPHENAERMFRRYRKLREAQRRIPSLLEATKKELERLDDLLVFVQLADTEGALRELQRDVHPESSKSQSTKAGARSRRGPARYRRDGFTALIGRSAGENDEVTFRLAGRNDWWLHARERTGAHVVLQGQTEPADTVLVAAAALAAYFSEARTDTAVDVVAARVRDVRKISGGPPGRVTYRNTQTIRVRPSLDGWERV